MAQDDVVIDPWGSAQSTDYDRIIEQFGLSSMDDVTMEHPSRLHRRGIVFAHRDLDQVRSYLQVCVPACFSELVTSPNLL